MKQELTELVFILDKSGSMGGLETDTIGGFNALLSKQKDVEGECNITTVLFDNHYELLHDRISIEAVSPLTNKEYQVGGTTALLDAIGRTVNKIINVMRQTASEYQAGKVMFVIITDGYENSSREYSHDKVRELIERQKNEYDWEFIFLGANIDAISTAGEFGISPDRAVDYLADSKGIELNFKVLSNSVRLYREKGRIAENSFAEIQQDVKERGGRD
ncbi:MAG: vWA domain-containing protein [Saccharofermentanales bacterium]